MTEKCHRGWSPAPVMAFWEIAMLQLVKAEVIQTAFLIAIQLSMKSVLEQRLEHIEPVKACI